MPAAISHRTPFVVQWGIFSLVLLVLGGLAAYALHADRAHIDADERARLLAQARVIERNLSAQIDGTNRVFVSLRRMIEAEPEARRFPPALNEQMTLLEQAIPGVRTFLVLDAAGNARLSNRRELIGRNFAEREYFKAAQQYPDSNRLFVSRPFKTSLGSWGINLSRVLIGRDGEFAGVITATLDPEYFSPLLSSVSYAPDLRAVIVHGDGDIYLMVPAAKPVQGQNIDRPGSFFARHVASARVDNVFAGDTYATGERRMVALRTVRPDGTAMDKPLVVIVTRDLDAIYQEWRATATTLAALLAVAGLLSGTALAAFQRRQSRHLERIRQADAELRRANALLERRTADLGEAQAIAHVGSWTLDIAPGRLAWSDEACRIFGVPVGTVVTLDDFLSRVYPDDREGVRTAWSAAVAGAAYDIEHRILVDGELRWVHERAQIERNSEGAAVSGVGTVQDITERKRTELDLRDSEEWAHALFQNSADAVLVHRLVGSDGGLGRFIEVNDTAVERYGYTRDELLAMTPVDLDEERTYPSPADVTAFVEHALAAGDLLFERVHVAKDGRRIPVEVSSHVFELKGQTLMLSVVRDVTARKKAERALREAEERWSFALEGGGDCVWDWNLAIGEIQLSKSGKRMFGYGDEEIGDRIELWAKLIHPDDAARVNAELKAFLKGETQALVSEYRVRCKDGRWKWILTRGTVVARGDDGRVVRMVGTHADVTERREREEARKLAATVFDTVAEGVLVTDASQTIVAINPGFTAITGYAAGDALGKTPAFLSAGTHPAEFYRQMWSAIEATGGWQGEVLNRRKDGSFYVEWLSIQRITDDEGKVSHYVGVFSDISERKASEERIRYLAHYDALTGLPNRALLLDRIHQAMGRARRDKRPLAILFFDLDRFKPVNDTFGHDVGDRLLIEVGKRVSACVRESDTVARLGGDEFVVLLAEIEAADDALTVGAKLLDAIERPFDVTGLSLNISASIGIALYPAHGEDEATLLKNADAAMYQAKADGRKGLALYQADAPAPGGRQSACTS